MNLPLCRTWVPLLGCLVVCDGSKVPFEGAHIIVPVHWHAEGVCYEDAPQGTTHAVHKLRVHV